MLKIRRILSRSFELTLTEGDARDIEQQGLEQDLTEIVADSNRPAKTNLLRCLRVSTIDNFQGEEAKVVIISLVRSNQENKCGFLKTPNRINVLLSRAMHGMYIIGNSATSGHVGMWADVIKMLKEEDNFGPTLELLCPRHPDTPIHVSTPDDFVVFSPEGGCHLRCDRRLKCGHACINKCHSEVLHNGIRCLEECPRSLRGCDHSCPKPCGDSCVTKCKVMVRNIDITLPCGHHRDKLPCWQAQDPSKVKCDDMVARVLPSCKHEVQLACHINTTQQLCQVTCGQTLKCGHTCRKKCFECTLVKAGKEPEEGKITRDHGSCQQICGRLYTTCTHSCQATCHAGQPCPKCTTPCEIACSHSKCDKICSEPCAPCAEADCASACPHSKCTMPCASPCNWLPCSLRCEEMLPCGHQCPTVCGGRCPPSQFCQVCGTEEIRTTQVEYIMLTDYASLDLNEEPCIIPSCGHILAVSSMDGHMEMSEHYEMKGFECVKVKDQSEPYSMNEIKRCPNCRGQLRSLSRYGRIVRRALIDQSSKRFILWSRETTFELMQALHKGEQNLQNTLATATSLPPKEVKLDGTLIQQIQKMSFSTRKRYIELVRLRGSIAQHLHQVSINEQPYKRVWDLTQNAKRKRSISGEMNWDPSAVQIGESLRVQSLLLRCDLTIIDDFFYLNKKSEISLDASQLKSQCLELAQAANQAHLPLQEAEGYLFYARFCIIERTHGAADKTNEVFQSAKQHIEEAKKLCIASPGSTRLVSNEVDAVERALNEATFYVPMKGEEWAQVLSAMKNEWIGTGHWYTCENGHPFAIGECGGPMEETTCPECGSPVGGQGHRAARGVTAATNLESMLDGLHL